MALHYPSSCCRGEGVGLCSFCWVVVIMRLQLLSSMTTMLVMLMMMRSRRTTYSKPILLTLLRVVVWLLLPNIKDSDPGLLSLQLTVPTTLLDVVLSLQGKTSYHAAHVALSCRCGYELVHVCLRNHALGTPSVGDLGYSVFALLLCFPSSDKFRRIKCMEPIVAEFTREPNK